MAVSYCFTVLIQTKGEERGNWKGMALAQNTRVMPNCVYASNPYHECTESCLQRIKEGKPPKNKKGAFPLSFGRKTKLGSKPELPVRDSVPASKIGAIYLSDGSSRLSNNSEKKMEKPKSNDLIPVSGEIQVADDMPINQKVHSKAGAEYFSGPLPTKQDGDKNSSTKVVPVTSVDNRGGLTKPDSGSMNYYFSGGLHDNEDSDGEETESVVSESRVPVGKYHVKESFAPILRSIFEKYGDIGASCHLESVVMRSYYIECVCFVVQELQSTPIMQLTKSKVKELLAIIKDVESAQLRVAWLRSIVEEIAEKIELINEHQVVEMAKGNFDREADSLKKELESKMEILAQKEREVTDIKTRIEEINGRLSELELKSSDLDKNMLSLKSKVENLDSRSLLDELL